jgi:hypothetical protein
MVRMDGTWHRHVVILGRLAAALGAAVLGACGAREELDAPVAARTPATPPARHPSACPDADGDGHAASRCGGDDCDDTDPAIHPGGPDLNAVVGRWRDESLAPSQPGDERIDPALVVDPGGAAHLFWRHEPGGIVHATNRTGAWVETVIGVSGVTGDLGSARTRGGVLVVCYRATSGLHVGRLAREVWTTELVDPDTREGCAIAVDVTGGIYVAYEHAGGLRIARSDPGRWRLLADEPAAGGLPGIVVDASGVAHVTYGGLSPADKRASLRYGSFATGQWATEEVAAGNVPFSSLALDRAGLAHVAWADHLVSHSGVRYSRHDGSRWSTLVLPAFNVWSATIALDPTDTPHVGYADLGVHVATYANGAWLEEAVFAGQSGSWLLLDGAGAGHLAWSGFAFSIGTSAHYSTNRVVVPDGVDQNCDGIDGVDADGDGRASVWTGGDDPDDGL